jgi:hypothetical protein
VSAATLPPLEGFAATAAARACATPAGAYANCLALSARYAEWLRDQGVPAGLLVLRGRRRLLSASAGRWPFRDPASILHWTVAIDGWSVDWTARQFDPDEPWPRVDAIAALDDDWEEIVSWACERCPELLADPRHAELAPPDLHADHRRRARAGASRFPDPRHDDTAPLVTPCACAASVVDGVTGA